MNLYYFCPRWGFEHIEITEFLDSVKSAGYDGVEMHIPHDPVSLKQLINALECRNLVLIVQQHLDLTYVGFDSYQKAFKKNILLNAIPSAKSLNLHTGRDYFTVDQNLELIRYAEQVAEERNMLITHELHRGHFNYCGAATSPFIEAQPNIKFTADFSHWCCTSESVLEGQGKMVDEVCKRAYHFHARVGYSQSPQVPDPRDKRWAKEVSAHLGWWNKIVEYRRAEGCDELLITPEFGPFPYMTYHPNEDRPIADQWELNKYMMDMLRNHF